MPKTLKIGFDLDGVILYNPVRIFRRFARSILKPIKYFLFHQKKEDFYYPHSSFERFLWKLLHLTSFKINKGYELLFKLAKHKKIKLYLVTSRYDFLESDYSKWLKIISANRVFSQCFINKKNLQPDQFKQMMINKLKLDVYVEDNYDIIEKLNHHTKAKILWLTNTVDKNIEYPFKFYSLKEVCRYLMSLV